MYGGLLKSAGLAVAMTTVGLSAVTVQAADFGGDCCADLEERIAELEATTARKGNRKVSLTIYGKVNEGVMFWDDGQESNVYQLTSEHSRTRFGFKGKAKINDDWSAGYRIEIGIRGSRQSRVDQNNDDVTVIDLRHSFWYLASKTFGKLSVGQTGEATEALVEKSTHGKVDHFAKQDVFDWMGNFDIRRKDGTSIVEWRDLVGVEDPGEGERFNVVRYDTPTIAGFVASASWGEDDVWSAALRYSNKFADVISIKAAIGYGELRDQERGCIDANDNNPVDNGTTSRCKQWAGQIGVQHIPSGLYASLAYGHREDEGKDIVTAGGADEDDEFYYAQAGIRNKFTPYGATTIFGEYYKGEFGTAFDADDGTLRNIDGNPIFNSEVTMWGIGINQDIDAAAMDLYIGFRHYDADINTINVNTGAIAAVTGLESFQAVYTGAQIKF